MIASTANEEHETRRKAKDRRKAEVKSTQSEGEDEVQVRDGP